MKYGLSEDQLKQILDIIASYDEIEEAILFGSRAIDTYKEASDVDIAVKGKKVTASLASKLKYRFEEDTYLPFFFDFIAYSTITNESLKKHIDSKGVSIYRAGWKECKLGETGKVITGKTPSKNNPEDWGNDVLFITPSDYKNFGKKAYTSLRMLSAIGAERQKSRLLPPFSVLVTCIGSDMGKSVVNAEPCVTNQQINAIIPNNHVVNEDYLYYLTIYLYYTLRTLGGEGTAVPILNKSDFESIDIFLPPLPEQKTIASILSCLDEKIDLLHRQNKTLESIAETLFRQWFMEQAETDDIATLGEFALNIKENAKVEDLQKYDHYVGLEHIPRKSIALHSWGKPDKLESNKSVFTESDILFGKLRAYFHKIVFAPIDGVCSTDILVIRSKKKEWFSFCLFWFFNADVVEHSDLGSGGTRMPRTNWEILSSYRIPRPSYQRILEFDKIVRPMTENITFNISQIRTIEKLRDTLLPKLLSGEIRVEYDEN